MNIVVGICDMKVSNNTEDILITYALASCIGIAIYDPIVKVGGILHYMLPDSFLYPDRAKNNPFMFADTGLNGLLSASEALGAERDRLRIYVAGGADGIDQRTFLDIGNKNYMTAKKILSEKKLNIDFIDVGGNQNRGLKLEIKTGYVWLDILGKGERQI